ACGIHSVVRWEPAKEYREVVQLEFLCHCLAEQCMEGLLIHVVPLKDSLEKGIFDKARRFVGFLLCQNVKTFLSLRSGLGFVLFKPFLVEFLVSAFVKFYSYLHQSQEEMNMEPLSEVVLQVFRALPRVEVPGVETYRFSAPVPSSGLVLYVPTFNGGPIGNDGSYSSDLVGDVPMEWLSW
ncbi:hypothetical protein KI387_028297, partial [Taxus chinensis]